MSVWKIAVVLPMLVGGCRASTPDFSVGFRCSEQEPDCPDGQVCRMGQCQLPLDFDAGLDANPPNEARCGAPNQFGADFSTLPFWVDFFTNDEGTGGTVSSDGSALVVTVPSVANAFVSLNNRFDVELRDGRFSVETLGETGDVRSGFAFFGDDGGARMFRLTPNDVEVEVFDGNGAVVSSRVMNVQPNERWWSFAESTGTLSFDVSTDNETWRTLYSVPTPTWVELATLRLEGFSTTVGGTARFDNVNGGGRLRDGCKSTNLVERFDDPMLERSIATFEEDCTVGFKDNGLLISFEGNTMQAACGFSGLFAQSLVESSLSLEIKEALTPNADSSMGLEFESEGGFLVVNLTETSLTMQSCARAGSCQALATELFDPVEHRFWRIRETGGQTFFETGPDGDSWNALANFPTPWSLDAGRVNLFAVHPPGLSATLIVDNLNTN